MNNFFRNTIVLITMITLTACAKVPAGHVGVLFNLYGADRGVQIQEKNPGRYWLTWNEELYIFPTFTQTYTWQYDNKVDESLSFGTVEGLSVNADVGITYSIAPDKVTELFQTYRKGVHEITNTFLRNMVRDALVKRASTIGIEAVYGRGKAELIENVQRDVTEQVAAIGINVEKVYWIGDLRLPRNVTEAINAKIQATQMAEQRKNEVAQAEAEAAKEVAKADGEAKARLALAHAEAEAIRIKGEALRLNPNVIELNMIERWDGKLPVYQLGNSSSLIQLPQATQAR